MVEMTTDDVLGKELNSGTHSENYSLTNIGNTVCPLPSISWIGPSSYAIVPSFPAFSSLDHPYSAFSSIATVPSANPAHSLDRPASPTIVDPQHQVYSYCAPAYVQVQGHVVHTPHGLLHHCAQEQVCHQPLEQLQLQKLIQPLHHCAEEPVSDQSLLRQLELHRLSQPLHHIPRQPIIVQPELLHGSPRHILPVDQTGSMRSSPPPEQQQPFDQHPLALCHEVPTIPSLHKSYEMFWPETAEMKEINIPAASTNVKSSRRRKESTHLDSFLKEKLEEEFRKNETPSLSEMHSMADRLSLETDFLKVWFRHRRRKKKHEKN